MTNADDFALLNDLLDDRLSAPAAAALRERMKAEPALAAEFEALSALRRSIGSLPAPSAPPRFAERVRERAGIASDGSASVATAPVAPVARAGRVLSLRRFSMLIAASVGVAIGASVFFAMHRGSLEHSVEWGAPKEAAKSDRGPESSRDGERINKKTEATRLGDAKAPRGESPSGDSLAPSATGGDPTRPNSKLRPGGAVPPSLRDPSDPPPPESRAGSPSGGGGSGPEASGDKREKQTPVTGAGSAPAAAGAAPAPVATPAMPPPDSPTEARPAPPAAPAPADAPRPVPSTTPPAPTSGSSPSPSPTPQGAGAGSSSGAGRGSGARRSKPASRPAPDRKPLDELGRKDRDGDGTASAKSSDADRETAAWEQAGVDEVVTVRARSYDDARAAVFLLVDDARRADREGSGKALRGYALSALEAERTVSKDVEVDKGWKPEGKLAAAPEILGTLVVEVPEAAWRSVSRALSAASPDRRRLEQSGSGGNETVPAQAEPSAHPSGRAGEPAATMGEASEASKEKDGAKEKGDDAAEGEDADPHAKGAVERAPVPEAGAGADKPSEPRPATEPVAMDDHGRAAPTPPPPPSPSAPPPAPVEGPTAAPPGASKGPAPAPSPAPSRAATPAPATPATPSAAAPSDGTFAAPDLAGKRPADKVEPRARRIRVVVVGP